MADVKIASLSENTSPNDTNIMIIEDNSDTKKITFANIKSTLKTYFDGLYSTIANPTFTGTQNLPSIVTNGIKFPATQVPSADPNTLDDYEEGTFTPTIIGGTTAGVGTYQVQVGKYTKIGDCVNFALYVHLLGHTGAGAMIVSSLPFISNTDLEVFHVQYRDLTLAANYTASAQMSGYTGIAITQQPVGGGNAIDVPLDTSSIIWITGFYKIT